VQGKLLAHLAEIWDEPNLSGAHKPAEQRAEGSAGQRS
jgi:hypothetical protein